MELKDMPTILISVIVTVMLLGAMMIAFSSLKDSSGIYTTNNYLNNSFTIGNNTYISFVVDATNFIGLSQVRYTNGSVVEAARYTVSGSTINLTSQNGVYYADYTFKGGTAYNVTKSGESTLSNLSSNFPTVGTVIGITLLIGLLVGLFVRFRNR